LAGWFASEITVSSDFSGTATFASAPCQDENNARNAELQITAYPKERERWIGQWKYASDCGFVQTG